MNQYLSHRLAMKNGTATNPVKEKKGIAKQSDKRKVDQKEYVKIVKELLAIDPNCEIREFGCEIKASGLHHRKKRSPSTFLDRGNLVRCCSSCNLWIENNPLISIEKGYSISKHLPALLATHDTELNATIIEPVNY